MARSPARFFNTGGPCEPARHYMLPPERRLPGVERLIDQQHYFVVHAPRQTGKTTALRALAERLTAAGRYAAVHASCEAAQAAGSQVELGVAAVLRELEEMARKLPPELRPEPVESFEHVEGLSRLRVYLARWSERSPRPVVVFFDEIDSVLGTTLISILRQLRAGYPERPERFPQAVALVGLRDVRDYRLEVRPDGASLGTSSPFNVKVESLRLRDFTREEIAELYAQHTTATGQVFAAEVIEGAFELTRGQPWLVNALARQMVEVLVPDGHTPIERGHLEKAKEILIARRDTHLDSLVDRLREPRVQRIIAPILAGELLGDDVLDDDVELSKDLGLVVMGEAGLEIANPLYREIIPRVLTALAEADMPVLRASYVAPDGHLLFERLLDGFMAFWREHAEAFLRRQPYSEAAAQLVFMGFLHRVVNGGNAAGPATIDREYAIGSGRIDLCVRWPLPGGGVERFAIELKVWRDGQSDPLEKGLAQLGGYLERLGLAEGSLILFDQRAGAPPLPERCSRSVLERGGRRVWVVRV